MALLFGKLPRIIARVHRDARQEIFLNTLLFPKTFDKSMTVLEQKHFDLKEMALHTYNNQDLASWKADDDIRCILEELRSVQSELPMEHIKSIHFKRNSVDLLEIRQEYSKGDVRLLIDLNHYYHELERLTQKGDRTWKITLFSVGILFGGFVGLITSF